MPVSADYQFEVNGLLLGPGTDYEIRNIDGLDGAPIRARAVDRIGHGAVALGGDWMGIRIVALDVEVYAATAALLQPKLEALAAAFAPASDDVVVSFQLPGTSVRRINARPRECRWRYDLATDAGVALVRCRLDANDPRVYADTATQVTSTIAGAGTQDTETLTNSGAFATEVTVTINGNVPTGWARFTHNGQSRAVKVSTSGLTHATDVLVVDFATRRVTVNGTARDDLVDSTTRWWTLDAGNNSVKFDRQNADVYASDAEYEFRSAWV